MQPSPPATSGTFFSQTATPGPLNLFPIFFLCERDCSRVSGSVTESVVSLGVRASGVTHVAVTIPGPFPRLTDAPSREQATCARPPADARGVARSAAGLRTPVRVAAVLRERLRPTCASPPSYVRVPVVLRARASGFLLPFPARLHAQLLKPCDFQREVFTRPREPLCNDSGNFK